VSIWTSDGDTFWESFWELSSLQVGRLKVFRIIEIHQNFTCIDFQMNAEALLEFALQKQVGR
jgi:hypothetical protein